MTLLPSRYAVVVFCAILAALAWAPIQAQIQVPCENCLQNPQFILPPFQEVQPVRRKQVTPKVTKKTTTPKRPTPQIYVPSPTLRDRGVQIIGPNGPVPTGRNVVLPITGLEEKVALIVWPKTEDALVRWGVLSPNQSLCAIFRAKKTGQYHVLVVSSTNDYMGCTIVVGSPDPNPDPDPDPEPDPDPPIPGPRFVLVVHESLDRTPQDVLTLKTLRGYLEDRKHLYRFIDKDLKDAETGQPAEWLRPYIEAIAVAGLSLPVLVVDEDGDRKQGFDNVHAVPLPNGADSVQFVKKHGG